VLPKRERKIGQRKLKPELTYDLLLLYIKINNSLFKVWNVALAEKL
jgi:hypothetical protein